MKYIHMENIHQLPRFKGQEIIYNEDFLFFWKPPSVFSQWTPCVFFVENREYNCAEQYMMAEKARLFDDKRILEKILDTNDPKVQKSLGRKVAGYKQKIWEKHRFEIVVRGNLAKFSQNKDMLSELLASDDRILAEASSFDKIWGIGLRADSPGILNPANWKGRNLLGNALMKVREEWK